MALFLVLGPPHVLNWEVSRLTNWYSLGCVQPPRNTNKCKLVLCSPISCWHLLQGKLIVCVLVQDSWEARKWNIQQKHTIPFSLITLVEQQGFNQFFPAHFSEHFMAFGPPVGPTFLYYLTSNLNTSIHTNNTSLSNFHQP